MPFPQKSKSPPKEDKPTPLDQPPLRDLPTVETVDDEEDLAPHLRENAQRKPGDPNPNAEPLDFTFNPIPAANPTIAGLPPEEMISCTFLMPEQEDGSRVRAKIIERVQAHKDELAKNPDLH